MNKFSQWFESSSADRLSSNKNSKQRSCSHEGCVDEGIYRAPKSRYHLETEVDDWHWFCLIHIRDYNARWSYYDNMTEAEIESERRADVTGRRPSWPLGALSGSRGHLPLSSFQDPFGLFGETPAYAYPFSKMPTPLEAKALAALELSCPFSQDDLRRRYRELARKHHPDTNGGSLKAEEKIKRINEAYDVLKNVFEK